MVGRAGDRRVDQKCLHAIRIQQCLALHLDDSERTVHDPFVRVGEPGADVVQVPQLGEFGTLDEQCVGNRCGSRLRSTTGDGLTSLAVCERACSA